MYAKGVVAREPVTRRCRHGHHALLSWAEIDPDFGRAPVLLAVTLDGAPLDRVGPQLVLPQDRCGARYISGIEVIRVDGGYPPEHPPDSRVPDDGRVTGRAAPGGGRGAWSPR